MTQFLLKCFFITTVLFSGVLIGIQVASNNMVNMTGDESFSTAQLTKSEENVYTEIIQENKISSHDLEAKQKKLEQIESFNLFSQMGVMLSEVLDQLFSNILSKITNTVANILN